MREEVSAVKQLVKQVETVNVTPSVSNMRDPTMKAVMAKETTNVAVTIENVVIPTEEAQLRESVMNGTHHLVSPMASVELKETASVIAKCAKSRTQKQ